MAYKYILFDLDGTLCDPGPSISDCVDYALAKLGIEESDKSVMLKFVGPPLAISFKTIYGLDEAKTQTAIGYFRERFQSEGLIKYRSYPGMLELLNQLKESGKVLGVATSKPDHFASQILKNTGLDQYFDIVAAPSLQAIHATKGGTIRSALVELKNPPSNQVVMIGDREHDIIGARENGVDSIGVLYGYGERSEMEAAQPTQVVATVDELAAIVI